MEFPWVLKKQQVEYPGVVSKNNMEFPVACGDQEKIMWNFQGLGSGKK